MLLIKMIHILTPVPIVHVSLHDIRLQIGMQNFDYSNSCMLPSTGAGLEYWVLQVSTLVRAYLFRTRTENIRRKFHATHMLTQPQHFAGTCGQKGRGRRRSRCAQSVPAGDSRAAQHTG